ncbi:hypothetical protein NOVOSPHI9U_260046 [Novosphingobium sp. 9U]|nr:hypothetical protein NOVOSPHI9U_260046 [Novosphingobium sp. 9U]
MLACNRDRSFGSFKFQLALPGKGVAADSSPRDVSQTRPTHPAGMGRLSLLSFGVGMPGLAK